MSQITRCSSVGYQFSETLRLNRNIGLGKVPFKACFDAFLRVLPKIKKRLKHWF